MCFVRRAYPAIALLGVSAVAARAQRPVPRAVVRDGTLTFDGRATVGDDIARIFSVRSGLWPETNSS